MEMFKLGYKDAIKGVIMSVLSSVLTALLGIIQQSGLALTSTELKTVATVAVTTFLGYLLKNFFTDENDKFVGKI
jgi:hypothetical protein